MAMYPPVSRIADRGRNGRFTSLFDSTQRYYHTDRGTARDMTVAPFPHQDAVECRRRQALLELLLRRAKGLELQAKRHGYPSRVALGRCARRLDKLIKGLPSGDLSQRREQVRATVDAYVLEAQRILAFARQEMDQGRPAAIIKRITEIDAPNHARDPWRPATRAAPATADTRPLFTQEFPRNREPTDRVVTQFIPRAATSQSSLRSHDEIAGDTRRYQDIFDVAGATVRGDAPTDWRKFKKTAVMPLSNGNKLEINSLQDTEIMSFTLIKSETEKRYAKGTLQWERPPDHAEYANLTFGKRRKGRGET